MEEKMYKRLPGFTYYWTTVFFELLVFTVAGFVEGHGRQLPHIHGAGVGRDNREEGSGSVDVLERGLRGFAFPVELNSMMVKRLQGK